MFIFLLCEALSFPRAEMGIGDDWSYIRTANLLAQTGHIHYNGWAAPMLGWQLYPAAMLLKLFGFSFMWARLSNLLVGALTAFLIQRTFVRVGVDQANSIIGTLAIVLTPLYMELSSTFMTDLPGLFAVVVCLYASLRALQAEKSVEASSWICFAALSNAILGTCRQIAWLGVLVMVPSALYLLRRKRNTFLIGALATLSGWIFIAFCMHWLKHQPYAIPEGIFFKVTGLHQWAVMFKGLGGAFLESPFLILPLVAAYLVVFPEYGRRFWKPLTILGLGYMLMIVVSYARYGRVPHAILEPRLGDWVTDGGGYSIPLQGLLQPVVLHTSVKVILTGISLLSTFCVIAFLWSNRKRIFGPEVWSAQETESKSTVSWRQFLILIGPFTAAYFAIMVPRASVRLMDRYFLTLTFVLGLFLVRTFQDFVRPTFPAFVKGLVLVIAVYSIGCNHDMFAAYRAIATANAQLPAARVAPNNLDGGFEYDHWVEMVDHGHINDEKITNPPNSFLDVGAYTGWSCDGDGQISMPITEVPHFAPRYGLSWDPNICGGISSFPSVSYFRWLGLKRTSLYIVKFQPFKASSTVKASSSEGGAAHP